MGLFSKKPQEEPIFSTSYLGFWIKVFPNRVEFKAGVGQQSIPINQIASVQLGMMGLWEIVLETTGGKKYKIPTHKKKEVQKAIYDAQSNTTTENTHQPSIADELTKLHALKEKGIITNEEFEKQKNKLLH